MKFTAMVLIGLEKLAKDEIKALGIKILDSSPGKITFEGSLETLYLANLRLRTVERILIVVGEGPAKDFDELFETIQNISWAEFLAPPCRVVFDKVRIRDSALTSISAIQAVAQKALYQKLTSAYRVNQWNEAGPTVDIRLYLDKNRITVGLDTSGDGLTKRGYRKMTSAASLKETLASALLLFSGWRRRSPLADPFCGSGTILTEALLFAFNIPPGLHRNFGFENLKIHSPDLWKKVKADGEAGIDTSHKVRLWGSDKDKNVLYAAKANLQALGLEEYVKLDHIQMEEASAPFDEPGFLISNPPFGERLEDKVSVKELYRKMGDLRERFPQWKFGFLTTTAEFPELFGQPSFQHRKLHNGSMDLHYFQFLPESGE